ncbi:MAG: LysR family transcriptional regulator [Acetobacteraceae bacterium]|nr:LysR family transcriptional regulator [Acetobacteraceae bacterium]MCX7683631.1 LysR family transcriptional regulator [Acetobacteraceae bacterium]MDW8397218.1 LysR family transcriptional regulator [Acetobacteraceae bacterium]
MRGRLDCDTLLLRAFVAVAESGSFTRAAERIGRSQPAVTLQIKRLEELLGRPLIARSSRHVALTAAGEILLPAARAAIAALDQAAGRLAGGEIGGELRFGSPEDFATAYLPAILARFVAAHPGVVLRTNCELTRPLIEGLSRGAYDLVVIKQAPGQAVAGAREIRRETLVWAEAEGWGRPRAAPLDLVLSPEPCVYRERAIAALDAAGIPWRVVYTSPSLAGAAAAVRAGLGITVLPRRILPAGLVPAADPALPPLADTAICLLLRPGAPAAAEELAAEIAAALG